MKEFDINYTDYIGNTEIDVLENQERIPVIEPNRAAAIIDLHPLVTQDNTHCISSDDRKECVTTAPYNGETLIFPTESSYVKITSTQKNGDPLTKIRPQQTEMTLDTDGTPVISIPYNEEIIIFPEEPNPEYFTAEPENVCDSICLKALGRENVLVEVILSNVPPFLLAQGKASGEPFETTVQRVNEFLKNFRKALKGEDVPNKGDLLDIINAAL